MLRVVMAEAAERKATWADVLAHSEDERVEAIELAVGRRFLPKTGA